MSEVESVPDAKFVGGWYVPEQEQHLVEMMAPGSKQHRVVEGRRTYQYHKQMACMRVIPEGVRHMCIDVGGHVGFWSYWLARDFSHVKAFEPHPLHQRLYKKNMQGRDNWELFGSGLGNEFIPSVQISEQADNTGNTHIVPEGEGKHHTEIHTLDSYNFSVVDFIKIDVEGYELQVVEGAAETITRCKPVMIVEQKGNDQKFFDAPERDKAVAFLHGLGMKTHRVMAGDHILVW